MDRECPEMILGLDFNRPRSIEEMGWRLVVGLMMILFWFLVTVLSITLTFVLDRLIGETYWITSTFMLLTVVPSSLAMVVLGWGALVSPRLNAWFWQMKEKLWLILLGFLLLSAVPVV